MVLGWILTVVIFGLDLVALLQIQHSSAFTRTQKAYQVLLVLLLPLFGAAIVILMNRLKPDTGRGDFPPAPEANRDAVNASLSHFNP